MTAEERQNILTLAEREIQSGNYAEGERLAIEAQSSSDPENSSELDDYVKAVLQRGNVARLRGDFALALELYTHVLSTSERKGDRAGVARACGNMGIVYRHLSDYPTSLEYHERSLRINEEQGNIAGTASNYGNIGLVYEELSNYSKALESLTKALSLDEELGNKAGVARHCGNMGLIYMRLSDFPRALEYYAQAMKRNEEIGNKTGVAHNLGNIGVVYMELTDYPKALEYMTASLSLNQELGSKNGEAIDYGNIGAVHANVFDYPKALEYMTKALSLDEDLGNKSGAARHLGNIGRVYQKLGDHNRALEYCTRALHKFQDLGQRTEAASEKISIGELYASEEWSGHDDAKAESYLLDALAEGHELGTVNYHVHKTLAELYERQKRWEEFAVHIRSYHQLKEEAQSEEAKKTAQQMEQRRQIAEREKEIAIAKAATDARMAATTTLLYKVLPESVATRMIDGEEEIADYFTSVSILFADIAGFTPISAEMPAIVVVRFLNYVFGEFDRIIKKHGCEKIKTIGDGYMAVCGAPIECADHAERLAAAALEMQETITLPESIREHMPKGVKLGVRIGLHTGSVVAGVIGEERFVYDVYSDAVNTAARMESHGDENKIHVSNDFYQHLQNRFAMTKNTTNGLLFEKRGELEIKGKGLMRTYFLERI